MKAEIRASVLGNSLDYPKKQRRRHPYWIIHPKDITQIVDVKFPNKWKTDASSMPIEHQAFRYDGKVTPRDDGYRGEYHYASLASEVQAKDFESYHSGMEQISDDLSLYLTHKAHHKTRMEARTIQWLPIPNHRLTSATCSSGFPPASDCLPALVLPRGCISMIQFHGSRCLGTRMGLADG